MADLEHMKKGMQKALRQKHNAAFAAKGGGGQDQLLAAVIDGAGEIEILDDIIQLKQADAAAEPGEGGGGGSYQQSFRL